MQANAESEVRTTESKEYQRERYYWLKSNGICVSCGRRDAWNGRTMCEYCIERHANYDAQKQRQRSEEQREAARARNKARYWNRRESGKCINCGAPATVGVRCLNCSIIYKKYNKERYQQKRADREYVTVWEERAAKDLCHRCGGSLPKNNTHGRMCATCAERCGRNLNKDTPANRARKERAEIALALAFQKR